MRLYLCVCVCVCCTCGPQLLDETQNLDLLRASFEASKCGDYPMRAHILNSARRRLQATTVDFTDVIAATTKLTKKPLRVSLEVPPDVAVAVLRVCVVLCLLVLWFSLGERSRIVLCLLCSCC